MKQAAQLMSSLGYQFQNTDLLSTALTHRSKAAKNYERLEFLGDSILDFVVAQWLFDQYPDMEEGQLTRMRASLVRKEVLADVARSLQLGDHLLLGEGELKSGGFRRDSILSDTVESIIAAIYLDADLQQASSFIFTHFDEKFKQLSSKTSLKDAKSQLQERMQKTANNIPLYKIIETAGEQHNPTFTVRCRLDDFKLESTATAKTRRLAEQRAAANLLEILDA